jgi:putative dimethyl sulfoxide reductase chaperone
MQADRFIIPTGPEYLPDLRMSPGEMRAHAGVYTFLGRCLECEVDKDLLDLLRGPMKEALDEMGLRLGRDVMEGPADEVIEVLAEEYSALFVVPGGVLPYRSVYESGRLFQPQADLAANAYKEAGFKFRNLHSGEFADHAAVMLAFVGLLLTRQAEAAEEEVTEAVDLWNRRRVRFLRIQIGRWIIGWSRRARGCSRHDFYSEILGLTEAVVWADVSEAVDEKTLRMLVSANKRPLVREKTDHGFRKASGL